MLGKNLISSVLTQIPLFILGVLSGVFSTRVLGDESKGAFSLFQANIQLFVLVFSLGIQTGIVYFISSKKIAENIVATMSIYIFIISCATLLILLFVFQYAGLITYILPVEYISNTYSTILFFLFAFTFFNSIISAFFQAYSKFKIINSVSIINSLINATLFIGLYFIVQSVNLNSIEKFNYVLYTTLLSLILNTLLWLYHQQKKLPITFDFSIKVKYQLKQFISYNFLIYVGMFVNFFNYRMDLWIVNNYLDEKNLSYYALAANINQIILYISVAIASVMLPNLSKKNKHDRISMLVKISRICFLFFGLITLTAFILSTFVIPFIYGIEFGGAVLPFQILLPGVLFSAITQLFSIFIVSINKNIFNIIACTVGLLFTIILDMTLIPIWGISGAAIATSISYFVIFLITFIFVFNQTNRITCNLFIPSINDIKFTKQFLNKRK